MDEQNKKDEIEEIFSYYGRQRDKNSQEMIVALLRELQEVSGCLTPDLKCRVLETTGTSEKFLQCLIRMYPSLKESNAVHEIIACTGERCGRKDGILLLKRLRTELDIQKNGMSADGAFELRTRNCLKKCKTAPNIMIDGIVYSGDELQDIKNLLKKLT